MSKLHLLIFAAIFIFAPAHLQAQEEVSIVIINKTHPKKPTSQITGMLISQISARIVDKSNLKIKGRAPFLAGLSIKDEKLQGCMFDLNEECINIKIRSCLETKKQKCIQEIAKLIDASMIIYGFLSEDGKEMKFELYLYNRTTRENKQAILITINTEQKSLEEWITDIEEIITSALNKEFPIAFQPIIRDEQIPDDLRELSQSPESKTEPFIAKRNNIFLIAGSILAGSGLIAEAFGIAFGHTSQEALSNYQNTDQQIQAREFKERAEKYSQQANYMYGIGGGLIFTGATLVLLHYSDIFETGPSPQVYFKPQKKAFLMSFSF